jgi:hypothetical protein
VAQGGLPAGDEPFIAGPPRRCRSKPASIRDKIVARPRKKGITMSRYLLLRCFAVVMICLGFASSARAQSAVLRVGDSYACSWVPGLHILPVNVSAAGPVGTARFKIVASSPVTFVDPPNAEFNVHGLCAQYGAIASLVVIIPPGPSVMFTVVPATGDTEIEMMDCDGYALHAAQECDLARLVAPYRPTPADGAIDVPTNQLLSYIGDANHVVIATSPDFSNQQVICSTGDFLCDLPLNPGPLAPHTTYYWQAANVCICGQVYPGHSEVFSFTTGDAPLATQAASWGQVKAKYRK